MSRENLIRKLRDSVRQLPRRRLQRKYERLSDNYDRLKKSKPRLKTALNYTHAMLEVVETEIERRSIEGEPNLPGVLDFKLGLEP